MYNPTKDISKTINNAPCFIATKILKTYNKSSIFDNIEEVTTLDGRQILALKLRQYRAERGISRETFSFECGISARFLNEIENAKAAATIDTVDALCAAIGVSISKLFEYDEYD